MNPFRFLGPSLGLSIVLALTACSSPISSVQVKAKPTLYASLGQYTYQMSSYVNPTKIESMLGNPTGLSIYNYTPTGATSTTPQEYLLHYPLLTVPLNFGNNLANLNLSSLINTNIPAQSFTIPSLSNTQSVPLSLDVNSVLRSAVNSGLSSQTATVGETGQPSPPALTVSVPLSISSFTSVTVASGALNLTFGAVTGATSGFTLSITNIALVSGGSTLSSTSTSVSLNTGGTASLTFLANTVLPNSFTIQMTISTSGGTLGHTDTFSVTPQLSSTFAVSAASGVNFTSTVTIPATNFPLNAASNFVSAIIGATNGGSVTVTPGSLPSGWTGFTQSTTVSISQTGGLSLNQTGAGTLILDLSNQTINANTISLSGSTIITATNASFTGLSGPTTINSSADITVNNFASVTVKPGSTFNPSTTVDYNLMTSLSTQQQQMWQWVNYIDFSSVGFDLSFTNNLPPGNDMSMSVVSQAFGINQTQTLISGSTSTPTFVNGTTTTPYKYVPSNNYGAGAWVIDLAVTLQPKSWNASLGELTLYNITPGSTLNFSASLTPVTTWTDASVSPQTGGYSGTFPSSGSYDLSSLTKYLGSNFQFTSTPADIYLSSTGLAANTITGITAYLGAKYTYNGALTTTPLLGTSSSSPANVTMLTSAPTFPADGSTMTAIPQYSVQIPDISGPLNAQPKDLVLNYSLNMGAVIITPALLSGTTTPTLEADLLIPLTFQFNIPASGSTFNFNSTAGTDFFGRTSPLSTNVNNLLNQLVSMTITLNFTNTTGLTGAATLSDGSGFSKSLTLTTGSNSIPLTLTSADILHIINTIPFTPSLSVTLNPSGSPETVTIPNGSSLTASASVTAVADINQTYNF